MSFVISVVKKPLRNSLLETKSLIHKEYDMIKIANAPCSWGVLEFDLEGEVAQYAQVLQESYGQKTICPRTTLRG